MISCSRCPRTSPTAEGFFLMPPIRPAPVYRERYEAAPLLGDELEGLGASPAGRVLCGDCAADVERCATTAPAREVRSR